MKINCDTAALTQVCMNLQRCVPTKSYTPLLDGILMRTNTDGKLELCGYDLDLGAYTTLEARIEEQGSTVINAKTLCDILKHLPGDRMTLDCNEKNICTIKSGTAEYTIVAMKAAEYPELPKITEEIPVTITQKILKSMIIQTIFAVAMDESKTVHRGIKFEIENSEIRLIALDGYRLAVRTDFIEYNGTPLTFIVPSKALNELVRMIGDEDEFVSVILGKRHIIFSFNGYNIISRLLDGDFIDYKTAIPNNSTTTVRVNTKDMIECIERTSIIMDDKTRSPLRFIFADDIIRVSAVTALGSANDKISASIDGIRTEIGFNNRYFLDALRASETDEVLVQLNGSSAPGLILPPEGTHFMYLILPVRLKNED